MKRLVLLLFLSTLSFSEITAQDAYQHAIGFRAGPLTGVSYKRFIGVPSVIEGILGYNYTNGRTVTLAGLYEHHIFVNYRLNLFIGAGTSFAYAKDDFRINLEAIAGLEYVFPNYPLNFSLDYKPVFHIFDGQFLFNEFALSIRYIL